MQANFDTGDVMLNPCPECRSANTSRFQWVDNDGFEYWTCWDCDRVFVSPKPTGPAHRPGGRRKE